VCAGRDRMFLRLGINLHFAPVRALETLRIPYVKIPVNKYITPAPGATPEFPYYHDCIPLISSSYPSLLQCLYFASRY